MQHSQDPDRSHVVEETGFHRLVQTAVVVDVVVLTFNRIIKSVVT